MIYKVTGKLYSCISNRHYYSIEYGEGYTECIWVENRKRDSEEVRLKRVDFSAKYLRKKYKHLMPNGS